MGDVRRQGNRLRSEVDEVFPSISDHLSSIVLVERSQSLRVLGVILGYACQSQNMSSIDLGRKYFAKLPSDWIELVLIEGVDIYLDINDYWEYLRLLELLAPRPLSSDKIGFSSLFEQYIRIGLASDDPEIVEAAQDAQDWDRGASE